MKTLFKFAVLLSIILLPRFAAAALTDQDLATAASLRDQALQHNEAWSMVESLTTEIGPRLAGGANDARAVTWAVKKLEGMGFDRVWTEPVHFRRWIRGSASARIVAPFPQPMTLIALGGSGASPAAGLTAQVLRFANYQALKDASTEQVRGKIVFIANRMQRQRDGSGYGPAVIARSLGAVTAGAKGAVAILIRSIGTDHNRTPHTGVMRVKPGQQTIPALALSNPDADLLGHELDRGDSVRVQLASSAHWGDDYTSHNVIAELTGRVEPDQYVVIGGHLDSWDPGTGAIDDGAGVAITSAAAKLIADLGRRPRRSIRVFLFANEESGLYGARQYAQAHPEIKNMLAAESDFGAGRIYQLQSMVLASAYPLVGQMATVLAPLGITLGENGHAEGSDISAFQATGTALLGLSQDGTNYFDYHHTANDTLDKIDPQALNQNVAAWAVITYLAAQADVAFGPVTPTRRDH